MDLTSYHAKYFAFELTKRCASDSLQKLTSSLSDAQVDLNPHQVEAALFAFRSPLSKGAILADEVGLGKTIEAGIVISQKWAERKRKILIILPSNLRKQWNQELLDKFFLPSKILETKSFNQEIKQRRLNPFDQQEIVICSYHFARSKDAYIGKIPWDLVVIDEAHRLRNVYKTSNKIANAIKSAVAHAPKLLLTPRLCKIP
ncbi:MAG: SNF2-related protein [Syntrophales bacterium]|nr:SNF2-related protein [Syntrophales bacterium]